MRSQSHSGSVVGRSWLALLSFALLIGGLGSHSSRGDDLPTKERAEPKPAAAIRLEIDFGDGVEKHFTALEWSDGMTVFDAMEQAAKHPRGIKITHRGKGATAFLTAIDGLENEGRGKNWTYRVNGELADRSFALFKLKGGDRVLWKFGEYR